MFVWMSERSRKSVSSAPKDCVYRQAGFWFLTMILFSGCGDDLGDRQYAEVLNEIDLRGEYGISSVISALDDPNPFLQSVAVEGLGRFESAQQVSRIGEVLKSKDAGVRLAAVNALGQAVFGKDGGEVADILLKHLLDEGNPEVQGMIARTLGRLILANNDKMQTVTDAILAMGHPSTSQAERSVILGIAMGLESQARRLQLDSKEPPERVVRVLEDLLGFTGTAGDGDVTEWESRATIRRIAMLALSSLDSLEMDILVQAAKDTDIGVRRIAMLALRGRSDASMELIEEGLFDSSPLVRVEAVRSYADLTEKPERCHLLLSMAEDVSLHVSLTALDVIDEECGKGSRFETTMSTLITESSLDDLYGWHRAAHALVALAGGHGELTDSLLVNFVSHMSPFARSYAARAATITGNVDVLFNLMEDVAPNVRVVAAQGLFAIRGHDVDSTLIAQLGSTDPFLVLTVARLLEGSSNRDRIIGPVMVAFERISQERKQTHRDPRVALLERIREFGGSKQMVPLEPYLRDHDPVIAKKVSEILNEWTRAEFLAESQEVQRLPMPTIGDIERMEYTVVTLHMERGGEIPIRLLPTLAPTHAYRFKNLAESGRLDGLTFHRVVSNFVIQGLSPGANEYDGHGEYTRDEIGVLAHFRGTVGTSTRGRDTGDGQIFINLIDNHNLNHDFTIFGLVETTGMETVDAVAEGDVVIRATVGDYGPRRKD